MKRKTIYIIGAGSTAGLGIPTSDKQKKTFEGLAESGNETLRQLYHIVAKRFENKDYGINDVFNLIDTALYLKTGLYVNKDGKEHKIEYTELLQAKRELISTIFEEFKRISRQWTIAFIKGMSIFIMHLQRGSWVKRLSAMLICKSASFS